MEAGGEAVVGPGAGGTGGLPKLLNNENDKDYHFDFLYYQTVLRRAAARRSPRRRT